jgi:hypothetical protein
MLAKYVPPRRDKLSFEEAAQAMSGAMAATLGETPSTEALALALGKTALETGRWGASGGLWNHNWGNVKASAKYEGTYTCIVLNEVLPLGLVWFDPRGQLTANPAKGGKLMGPPMPVPEGHPQTRMRAFAAPDEGALSYVRFVAGGRYAKAWELLLAGDAVAYVHALKVAGYFTADEATYARTTLSLQREFIAKLKGRPAPIIPVPPVEEVRSWLTRQDIDALEAALVEQGRDAVDENRKGALREMSGGEYDPPADPEPPPPGDIA